MGAREAARAAAAAIDELGYSVLWIANGPAMFEPAREPLGATRRIVVATGIASIWTHPHRGALPAGADHVCIQVATEDGTRLPRDDWRTLAAALHPASVRR